MKKIVRIGLLNRHSVFCKITISDGGNLSITGVVGPDRRGNCAGSCGQIVDELKFITESTTGNELAPGWSEELLNEFIDIWDKWHLNDMILACEHQEELWDLGKEVEIVRLGYGRSYMKACDRAVNGRMTNTEYQEFAKMSEQVNRLVIKLGQKYVDAEVEALAESGHITIKQDGVKSVNWLSEKEHPEGLLCKPCPVCGYKYGTKGLRRELPDHVVEFLQSLPDTDKTPAWV